MPTFANLTAYVDTVTAKLTKPRRGVGGAEGVRAADVLSALVDCGTYISDGLDSIVGKANRAGDTFTGAVNFTGKIGVNVAAPNGDLQFGNTINNRKIVLWEQANNEHEYYGFGLNSGVLRYQVDNPGADHVFYVGNVGGASSSQLFRIRGNGNIIVGSGADNNMAKLQTPSISLGVDFWHTSSDGQQRLYYQNNGNSYYSAPSNAVNVLRFGASEHYLISKSSFAHYFDGTSDWVHGPTTAASALNRVWTHRKEVNNIDYRFFDWDGSSARDWWNVYASSQKMSLAQIIHANYGSNVGIGTSTPDSSALLDLTSTTKGLLLPRLTTTERNAVPVSAARKGLLIMNVTTNKLNFYNGSAWEAVTSA